MSGPETGETYPKPFSSGDKMKFSVLALLIATSITSASFAGEDCGRKCTSGGAAAAASMTAGYTALKGYISIRDIEKRFLVDVFNPSLRLPGDYNVNKIKPGDKVSITYSESGHINSQYAKLEGLSNNLEEVTKYKNSLKDELHQAKNPKVFGFIAKEVDADEVQKLTAELRRVNKAEKLLLGEVSKVNQGLKVRHAAKTIVLRNTNDNMVAYKIRELVDSGKSVYGIKKVPSSVMKKMARARNGFILAGTAVAIGLITAEEIYSGKIAVKREEELKKFN
jgi:hypothetical protein